MRNTIPQALRFVTGLFGLALLCGSAFGSAANIYITPTGSTSGVCTASVQTPTFFNTAGNWGAGGTQIGADTVVHLCGAFSPTAGSPLLTVPAGTGGTNGHPVVVLFESGTSISSAYLGTNGAININGSSYIVIDGGLNTPCGYNPASGRGGACTGSIFATANGTNLANQQASVGVYVTGTTNVEVRNLHIYNNYIKVSNALLDGGGAIGVVITSANTNPSVHDCNISEDRAGISYQFESVTNVGANFYNNYIHHHDWGIQIGAGNPNSVASGINFYGNEVTDWSDWADTTGAYHTDGLIAYSAGGGTSQVTLSTWNNYLHGDLAGGVGNIAPVTAFLYCNYAALCTHFNNLIVSTGNNDVEGLIWTSASALAGQQILNNTMVGGGAEPCIGIQFAAITTTIKNNVCVGADFFFNEADNSLGAVAASDHNVMYNLSHIATNNTGPGPPNFYNTLASWQAACSCDAASVTTNPNLSAAYLLQLGSSAIGLGVNLTSLGITALDSDKAGVSRPSSAVWDAGTNQFVPAGAAPAPMFAFKGAFCVNTVNPQRKICCNAVAGEFDKPLPASLNLSTGYPGIFTATGCRNDRRAQ